MHRFDSGGSTFANHLKVSGSPLPNAGEGLGGEGDAVQHLGRPWPSPSASPARLGVKQIETRADQNQAQLLTITFRLLRDNSWRYFMNRSTEGPSHGIRRFSFCRPMPETPARSVNLQAPGLASKNYV